MPKTTINVALHTIRQACRAAISYEKARREKWKEEATAEAMEPSGLLRRTRTREEAERWLNGQSLFTTTRIMVVKWQQSKDTTANENTAWRWLDAISVSADKQNLNLSVSDAAWIGRWADIAKQNPGLAEWYDRGMAGDFRDEKN